MDDKVKISWWGKHFGEEPPLVGSTEQGAGTIFFTGCNMRCVFCQNYQISQENWGEFYSIEDLANIMLTLQKQGSINIDLVTPTIWAEQIKKAILLARALGLRIPIVWNSNGYEQVETIKSLAGFVDIYLPDFKYSDNELAEKYSGVKNYVDTASEVIAEMLKQVGILQLDEQELAMRGVLVRHLILPNAVENSFGVVRKLAELDKNIFFSLMKQYIPVYKAKNFPELNRPVNENEFEKVFNFLLEKEMDNGWIQEDDCGKIFLPDFKRQNPFEK